jgi:hypothetical protein
VHPSVLAHGGTLATDPTGMQGIWKSIAGSDQGKGRLRADEARPLAFLNGQCRRAQRGASAKRTTSGLTVRS